MGNINKKEIWMKETKRFRNREELLNWIISQKTRIFTFFYSESYEPEYFYLEDELYRIVKRELYFDNIEYVIRLANKHELNIRDRLLEQQRLNALEAKAKGN